MMLLFTYITPRCKMFEKTMENKINDSFILGLYIKESQEAGLNLEPVPFRQLSLEERCILIGEIIGFTPKSLGRHSDPEDEDYDHFEEYHHDDTVYALREFFSTLKQYLDPASSKCLDAILRCNFIDYGDPDEHEHYYEDSLDHFTSKDKLLEFYRELHLRKFFSQEYIDELGLTISRNSQSYKSIVEDLLKSIDLNYNLLAPFIDLFFIALLSGKGDTNILSLSRSDVKHIECQRALREFYESSDLPSSNVLANLSTSFSDYIDYVCLAHLTCLGRVSLDDSLPLFNKYLENHENASISWMLPLFDALDSTTINSIVLSDLLDISISQNLYKDLAYLLPRLVLHNSHLACDKYEEMGNKALLTRHVITSEGLTKMNSALETMFQQWMEFMANYWPADEEKVSADYAIISGVNYIRSSRINKIYDENASLHQPSNAQLISDFVMLNYRDLKPLERDKVTDMLIDWQSFVKIHPEELLSGGFSSYFILDLTDDVAKFATIEQNQQEGKVYSLAGKMPNFGLFISRIKGEGIVNFSDGSSMLVLENLRKRPSGYRIANMIYYTMTSGKTPPWTTHDPRHNAAMLNMFILGFAHKELKIAAEESGTSFPQAFYGTPDGTPHYDAIRIPLSETSNRTYREFMRTVPMHLIDQSGKIIDGLNLLIRRTDNNPIILGDNKIVENMCNGYLYDFAIAGRGLEIDDITYALVEPRLGIPLGRIKHYVRAYSSMRALHDEKFRDNILTREQEMIVLSDASILKSLSVYASCTRKRVAQMESGEIVPRRNYFINAMQFMLDHGNFSIL